MRLPPPEPLKITADGPIPNRRVEVSANEPILMALWPLGTLQSRALSRCPPAGAGAAAAGKLRRGSLFRLGSSTLLTAKALPRALRQPRRNSSPDPSKRPLLCLMRRLCVLIHIARTASVFRPLSCQPQRGRALKLGAPNLVVAAQRAGFRSSSLLKWAFLPVHPWL